MSSLLYTPGIVIRTRALVGHVKTKISDENKRPTEANYVRCPVVKIITGNQIDKLKCFRVPW